MRKVTFGGACSLDNYFAREDGGMDWLLWCDEVMEITSEYWPKVDCILMGRKTYEVAMEDLGGGENGNADKGITTYIFSRTLDPKSIKGAEVISENAGEFVRQLKAKEGKEICVMGGGELANSLLIAGVIDEIGFNVHPVLLGSGVPLFHGMTNQVDLELVECKPFKNGCVYLLYRVKN